VVDDRDKSASLVGNAFPRRSTSSLGAIMPKLCVALILFLASVSVLGAGPPPPRFPREHITLTEWGAYFDEVRSVADVRCEDTPRKEIYYISNSLTSAWVFTKEGHPAHPAVAAGILLRAYYAGDEGAFNAWAAAALRDPPVFKKWMQSALAHGT
jgi:hypothetical protein